MNKTLLFLLLPGLLISCKPTPPSGDNGEIVPLTSECLLKNSDLYMKYPYKIKVQDSIMCIWDLHGGDRFYHLYSYPELQFITSFAVNGRGPEEYISTGGFCMDEQHIYVFDTSRARLSIFRKDSLMQQRISPARIIDYPHSDTEFLPDGPRVCLAQFRRTGTDCIYRYLWTSAEQKIRDSVGKYRKKQSLPDDDSLTMELLSRL